MMSATRSFSKFWLTASLLVTACVDTSTLAPVTAPQPAAPVSPIATSANMAVLKCNADVRAGSIECLPVIPSSTGANYDYIVGGQGVNVRLASSNVSYDSGTGIFGADVTVQNLLPDALGTIDGTTLSPTGVRVFFESDPVITSGVGTISVSNEDGTGTFTATDQEYFQYNQILAANAISLAKRWEFLVTNGTTFQFFVYVSAPIQSRLVISEIMANPAVVADSVGEWFEIYNAGRVDVNLVGWIINSNSPQTHTIAVADTNGCGAIGCSVVVPRGGYVVLGTRRNSTTNGGVPVNYKYAEGTAAGKINLANGSATEFVAIASPAGVEVDRVTWGSATTATVAPSGASKCLTNLSADNSNVFTSGTWQTSTTAWSGSAGDKGSPGAANLGCGAAPPAGPITTVTVTPVGGNVGVGDVRQYSATGRDANGNVASSTYTWSIDNPGIATVSASGLVTGVAEGTTVVRALSANGISGNTSVVVVLVSTTAIYRNNVEFGVPTDANSADDVLISRPQFNVSYSETRGGPNWVSWNLNKTHFGSAPRCDCFEPDPLMPPGITPIVTSDYTGSGYSRGHMVMSEQRTTTDAENRTTFYTTNILPQLQTMNGGPWLQFENQNNDLARVNNKELYVISGGIYSASPATLNNAGKVQIPTSTWKIVVVVDSGETLASISTAADLEVYAVNMPQSATGAWQTYITTVDAIEAATGYDFLASLPDAIESVVEASAASGSLSAPVAIERFSAARASTSVLLPLPTPAVGRRERAYR